MKTHRMISRLLPTLALALVATVCGAKKAPRNAEKKATKTVVASTAWTAAFADVAGADGVSAIAPASMLHPAEYEVTADDILRIRSCDLFVYGGFERMMKALGTASEQASMHAVSCDNSVEAVRRETKALAALLGTQKVWQKRMSEYESMVQGGASQLEQAGWKGAKVFCHAFQAPLAKDLGFNVVATFGPMPVTADQIAAAKAGGFDLVIDNVHNPVAAPLSEVAPDVPVAVWRNFPDRVARGALKEVVRANVRAVPAPKKNAAIDENGVYYSKDEVALYIHTYGHLPSNFITKNQARALGWSGGPLEPYAPGKSIGGDHFGNYENRLPKGNYHECDIDTKGRPRGAKRLIYTPARRIYYTADHYQTFEQLY